MSDTDSFTYMSLETPFLSVIVPAHNEQNLLPACLSALETSLEGISSEVIVVDNQSTDRTAEIARDRGARVVDESRRQIARVRNRGAKSARGRHYLFVDADTIVNPDVVRETVHALASGSVVGGGSTLTLDRKPEQLEKWGLTIWNWIFVHLKMAPGGYLFARADAFRAVGGFDESVYASEELFLSSALKERGREENRTFHVITGSPPETSSRKTDWYSSVELAFTFLLFLAFPFLVRYRWFCRIWYQRP